MNRWSVAGVSPVMREDPTIYAFLIGFQMAFFSKLIGPCMIQFPDWFRTGSGLPDWSNYARNDQKCVVYICVLSGLVPD